MTAPINEPRTPPYKLAGVVLTILLVAATALVYFQFRGDFLKREQLVMMSARAGLSMDPGAKVTYNGVEIGRVASVDEVTVGDQPRAKITMDVDPQYIRLIPANVDAKISATTVFGNKYISFSSPKNPAGPLAKRRPAAAWASPATSAISDTSPRSPTSPLTRPTRSPSITSGRLAMLAATSSIRQLLRTCVSAVWSKA